MAVDDKKVIPEVINTDEKESPAPGEQTPEKDIKFVEDKEVKVKVDDKEVKVRFDDKEQPYVDYEDMPEDIEEQKEYIGKIAKELGKTLSNAKIVRTEQNELIKDYDTLKEQSALQIEKSTQDKKDLAELRKEVEFLKADKEKGEYLSIGMDYEAAYITKLRKELGVKTKAEEIELRGSEDYYDASVKAQAFAQAESLKTSSKASQRAMRLQGRNTELSALVRADGKFLPSKVIAYRDAHGLSNNLPEKIYNWFKSDHPQQDLATESNEREQKRLSKIRILKKSRVLPESKKKPTFQEKETEKLNLGIKQI